MKKETLIFRGFLSLFILISICTGAPACTSSQATISSSKASTSTTSATENPTTSTAEPEQVEGEDPEGINLYPDSMRTAYIVPNCECSSVVMNWYAVPATLQVVFNYLVTEMSETGWRVQVDENTPNKLYGYDSEENMVVICCYKSEQWTGYNTEMSIEWIPPERGGGF